MGFDPFPPEVLSPWKGGSTTSEEQGVSRGLARIRPTFCCLIYENLKSQKNGMVCVQWIDEDPSMLFRSRSQHSAGEATEPHWIGFTDAVKMGISRPQRRVRAVETHRRSSALNGRRSSMSADGRRCVIQNWRTMAGFGNADPLVSDPTLRLKPSIRSPR